MTSSSSMASYTDIISVLDRALEANKGLILEFDNPTACLQFVQRAHAFRRVDRKENGRIYPADHPLHGDSIYYRLRVVKLSPLSVKLERLEGVEFKIREVNDTDDTAPSLNKNGAAMK